MLYLIKDEKKWLPFQVEESHTYDTDYFRLSSKQCMQNSSIPELRTNCYFIKQYKILSKH